MEIVLCPNCSSQNLILLYPDADIWVCKDCGYRGRPIKIEKRYLNSYLESKVMVNRLR